VGGEGAVELLEFVFDDLSCRDIKVIVGGTVDSGEDVRQDSLDALDVGRIG
jgi:hypothetical protein